MYQPIMQIWGTSFTNRRTSFSNCMTTLPGAQLHKIIKFIHINIDPDIIICVSKSPDLYSCYIHILLYFSIYYIFLQCFKYNKIIIYIKYYLSHYCCSPKYILYNYFQPN